VKASVSRGAILANQVAWEVRRRFNSTYLKAETLLLQLCLWPLVTLATLVFSYAPFTGGRGWERPLPFTGGLSLGTYLILGTFAISVFGEYIVGGFSLSWDRDQGILEAVYLTPASRLGYLIGNALGSALMGAASLLVYVVLGAALFHARLDHPLVLVSAALLVLATSLPWGALLCAIFLVGRNTRVLYSLFESPAEFLSGVRFPVQALPLALYAVAGVYPLTHAVSLLRAAAAPRLDWAILGREAAWLVCLAVVYLGLARATVAYAERRGKVQGNLSYS
jgi:ABC-2 type transport system permease protein